jgi:hypothetical protein
MHISGFGADRMKMMLPELETLGWAPVEYSWGHYRGVNGLMKVRGSQGVCRSQRRTLFQKVAPLRLEHNDFWAISHSKSNLNAGNRLVLKNKYEFVFQFF